MRLILDNHTNEAGRSEQDNWGAQQKNGLWYDLGGSSDGTDGGGNPGTVTDATFLADWQFVARHYVGNQTVIGYDLRNEPLDWPHMSEWGGGSDRDIAAMYTRVGNAILAIDPTKLIIVEPPNSDARGVHQYPLTLAVANKLVYSVHEYPGEISGQKVSSGSGLIKRMNEMWGWIYNENVGPIFVGEMGSSMVSDQSKAWAATIVPYLNGTGPDGLHIPPGGQAVSTDWWAWGYLPGQAPDGNLVGASQSGVEDLDQLGLVQLFGIVVNQDSARDRIRRELVDPQHTRDRARSPGRVPSCGRGGNS